MVGTELVEARHDPSEHFVNVITFGDYSQLAVESTQESVRRNLFATQHVTTDVAQIFVSCYVSGKYVSQQCTYLKFAVSRFQHFGTCHGYCAGEIHTACIEETTDEDNGLRINCPHSFAL